MLKTTRSTRQTNMFQFVSCFLVCVFWASARSQDDVVVNPSTIGVGAVLSSKDYGDLFLETIKQINADIPDTLDLQFNATIAIMEENPIRAAKSICDNFIPNQVYVVIASHPVNSDLSPMAVSFTCGFYRIPVIGLSTRDSSFSDRNVHTSFMRTVPPYSDQARVWVELVKYFKWKKVVFLHSSDQEGRAMLGRFQSIAGPKEIEIELNIQFTSGQKNYTEELMQITTVQSRVILMYANYEDAELIYHDAVRLNMTEKGYAWVVTEQALKPPNVPKGIIGLHLVDGASEALHIQDALHVVAKAFRSIYQETNITLAPKECTDASTPWESGATILEYLGKQTIERGKTGSVEFNDVGDRINPVYDIMNIQNVKGQVKVGSFGFMGEQKVHVTDGMILFPGNQTTVPKGVKISTQLKVVTLESLPFIYAEPVVNAEVCTKQHNKIPCPRYNNTGGETRMYCCSGYAMDLLIKLAKKVNFTFDLHLVKDGSYGVYERVNGSKKAWNGMIGELVRGESDLIVAPLTINPERAQHIDFSKPFKYQGLTILVKKTTKDSSLASFLQPFQDTLWILVCLSVHVVALALYLLDRFSPFGHFKLAKSDDTEEDALNISSAIWFAWGVLLNSGIGEGTPRSFSARVLGMVWAGFAMIIVASYTANLAAFLVLDRPEASISGIDDARLRNPQENFKYATVKNSAVAMYFKRQVELSTMYRTMETRNKTYETADEAIKDVKAEELQAFIWDSSRLEYEAANDCDLVTAGELFGRSGYGIGLQKGSPWTHDISLAILGFHESGYMEQLDGKWILVKDTKCPEKDTSPATLGLTNMAGVFMMVAGGIVAGVMLIFVEIAYKRHRGLKEKELELAKTAADRWRGNIEKRRTLRRTLLQQQLERNKTNGTTDSPGPVQPLYLGQRTSGYQPVPMSTPIKQNDPYALEHHDELQV